MLCLFICCNRFLTVTTCTTTNHHTHETYHVTLHFPRKLRVADEGEGGATGASEPPWRFPFQPSRAREVPASLSIEPS
jgi:hypothetical protein